MKTALITGGSRGIGKAISECLAKSGYNVISPTRKELDLANHSSVMRFIESCNYDIDILINNAGQNVVQPLVEIDFLTWQRTHEVNLHSAFMLTQAFGKKMITRNWGRIVNVASIFSSVTRAGRAAYTSSKFGLVGLTKTAALEWAAHNILVNSVSPGFVDTELTRMNNSPEKIQEICNNLPIRRLAKPEEIAEIVQFLVSDTNTYLTGQNIIADGGYTLV